MDRLATLDASALRTAVLSADTFATTLLTVFVDIYGTDAFTWDPETIRMEIDDDLNLKIPDANFDRLMAAINLILSNDFYKSLPDFITYCNVLCGDTYNPNTWDPADASEIAWGITEGMLIAPPDEQDEQPFTDEITAYIGQALDQEGIMDPPDVLKIAIRNKDATAFVAGEYADDPIMFDAIYDLESSKTTDINNTVRQNLKLLIQQLEALPLRNGTTTGAVQQMLQSLS